MRPADRSLAAYRTPANPEEAADDVPTLVEVVAVWGGDARMLCSYLAPGERFVLAAEGDGRLRFAHPDHAGPARALVDHGGREVVVHHPERGDEAVTARSTVTVRVGDFAFHVRRVAREERLPAPRGDRLLGVALPLALVATALAAGFAQRSVTGTGFARDDAWRDLVARVSRRASRALPPTPPTPDGAPMGGTGQRAAGDEGASGARHASPALRRWREAPRRGALRDPATVRPPGGASDRASVRQRGIFAALGLAGLRPDGLPAPGVHAAARSDGNLYGPSVGEAFGYAGLGLLGTGWGGGAHAGDLAGLGPIRTRGHGDDRGTGQGLGSGGACGCGLPTRGTGAHFGARTSARLTVCGVSAEAWARGARCAEGSGEGSLAPEEIRRVVRRNLGQVRHCYERALAARADAAGRLTLRWVIGAAGTVLGAAVQDDATGAPALGACVVEAVRRWQFPAPVGGVVSVSYPFTVAPAE